jgi:subtilisin-like proprotein convertase family protein
MNIELLFSRRSGLTAACLAGAVASAAFASTGSAQFNERTRNFNNQTPITIADSCPNPEDEECAGLPDYYFEQMTPPPIVPADPYPSSIVVPAAAFVTASKITDVNVRIKNINHGSIDDVDLLLVGPDGKFAVLASNVSSGTTEVSNLNWKFDDQAKVPLPNSNRNTGRASGNQNQPLYNLIYPEWVNVWTDSAERTFKPSDYDVADDPETFPNLPQITSTPATQLSYPPAPYNTTDPSQNPAPTVNGGSPLSVFNGGSPTGEWKLYVVDDLYWYDGSLGGWAIEITAAAP